MQTLPLIEVHDAQRAGTAGDTEVWINPAHIVKIEPMGEAARVTLTIGTVYTVESYLWLLEKLTGKPTFEDTK